MAALLPNPTMCMSRCREVGPVAERELRGRTSGRPGAYAIEYFPFARGRAEEPGIAVVLSGMDGDGALGMRAIKGEGGITIAQSPESARYPDMPRTTILSDHVDAVLPPRGIAAQLERLGDQFRSGNVRTLEEGGTTCRRASLCTNSGDAAGRFRRGFSALQAGHDSPQDCAAHAPQSVEQLLRVRQLHAVEPG